MKISAANNLEIEIDSARWRLMVNGHGESHDLRDEDRLLVDANAGQPLRYHPTFGDRRRLPESGALFGDQIQRVVLGWSTTDSAWHLGLMLSQELAEPRGSRWCEIARWREYEAGQPGGEGAKAGEALAQTLRCPFNLVPPRPDAITTKAQNGAAAATIAAPMVSPPTSIGAARVFPEPTQIAVPSYMPETLEHQQVVELDTDEVKREPAPAPTLPIKAGLWTLQRDEDGVLRFTRASAWIFSRLSRAGWYMFWGVVYILLSYATLNSTLALPNAGTMLPNPEVLPYLGLASALLLFVMVLYVLIDAMLAPGMVVIDKRDRSVHMLRGDQTVWSKTASEIQAIYITHILTLKEQKKRKVKTQQLIVHHGELNLLVGEKKFKRFLRVEEAEELPVAGLSIEQEEYVTTLTTDEIVTPMQGAAYLIAQELNLSCYYDQRVR